jgi:hypothetical protein
MRKAIDVIMLVDHDFESDIRVEKEAQSLSSSGINVQVLALTSTDLPETEGREDYSILRCIDSSILHPLRNDYSRAEQSLKEIILDKNPTILHIHDFRLLGIVPILKNECPNLYVTYDSHEYLKGWPFYKEIPSFINRMKGFFVWNELLRKEKRGKAMCELILAPSASILQRQLKHTNALGLVLRNIPRRSNSDSEIYIQTNEGEKINLLMIGNIYMPNEILHGFIQYIEASSQYELYISGNRSQHKALKAQYNKAKCIHFLPYNSQNNLNLSRQADIGIAYTRSDEYLAHKIGSSNRLMEYSMAKLPILGSQQDSHAHFAKKYGHIVMFESGNLSSLIDKLNVLTSNLPQYQAKARLIEDLSWDLEIKPLIKEYQSRLMISVN